VPVAANVRRHLMTLIQSRMGAYSHPAIANTKDR
jgi:hypothetical protein